MTFSRLFLLFSLFSLAFSQKHFDSHLQTGPLIVEYTDNVETQLQELKEELRLQCTSWRFSVEANNLGPWRTIPEECRDYVKDYMTNRGYDIDLERVSKEAGDYAKTDHRYGLEIFDHVEFDKWVEKAIAPAIEPSLKLYEQVLSLGFKVFLLTGRAERHRKVTVENLINTGFRYWDKLILRGPDDHGKLAVLYKSEKISEMEREGYRILGNSGDQWSDLLGTRMSTRSFKLPNPMYYIA
ncbi:acid phosphatase 1 [Morus notabilis]|uniref:acid phosphatase 1 n=1 Tax=Morus notabilis TaxID=981085 RepID=UPI000CED425B|nr:acid phosphatase 1 [Morus notabilis]